jgi:hypothetical protein
MKWQRPRPPKSCCGSEIPAYKSYRRSRSSACMFMGLSACINMQAAAGFAGARLACIDWNPSLISVRLKSASTSQVCERGAYIPPRTHRNQHTVPLRHGRSW